MSKKKSNRKRIGNYELLAKLGQGGMARLYRARHLFDGRLAAIKVLHRQLAHDESFRKRLLNEARAIASLDDPSVVKLYDCGQTSNGHFFLVMEYIEGETLGQHLSNVLELPVLDAIAIAKQVASALSAVHAVGITHRDLTPHNVMLVKESGSVQAKLLDFGLARSRSLVGFERNLTRPGTAVGTPSYMSPEQCAGYGEIDHRADIYGLGVLLYRMLTGRAPFTGNEPSEIIVQHLRNQPTSPRRFRPAISKQLEAIVMRCLAKKPVDRFQSVSTVREALSWEMSSFAEGERSSEEITRISTQVATRVFERGSKPVPEEASARALEPAASPVSKRNGATVKKLSSGEHKAASAFSKQGLADLKRRVLGRRVKSETPVPDDSIGVAVKRGGLASRIFGVIGRPFLAIATSMGSGAASRQDREERYLSPAQLRLRRHE